jgi:hypothetical protein
MPEAALDMDAASAGLTADPAVAAFVGTPKELPRIATPREYELLPQGSDYLDPEGQKRLKPWSVTSAKDYEEVPEGSEYRDPTGTTRLKPRYQGVGMTAQTLYDMALTDREREKVLERSYPGKVRKAEGGDYYVDDEGTLRKPGRGVERVFGAAAAMTAPTALGALGALGAGTLAAPSGPGAFFAAAGGGFTGALAGQEFNDLVLQLAGVYDRTPGENLVNLGTSGLAGMAGAGVGRGIATVVRGAGGASALGQALPQLGAKFVGASPEGLRTAKALADKGVLPPPSGWAKEAPHIQNIVEVFDPAFHTQEPLLQSATEHYEKGAQGILRDLGVEKPGPVVKPTAAPSTEEAGVRLLAKAREESAAADARLRAALDARKTEAVAGAADRQGAHEAQTETLRAAEREAREKAQGLIDAGFADIQRDADEAMRATKAGHNSGDLWWRVGEKLKAIRQGIQERARTMYDRADELAGEHRPDIGGLPESASAFLEQLPEGFEGKYPTIVRQLRDLAGVEKVDPKTGLPTGEWEKPPVQPTFGQLHNLRSILRSNYSSLDLTPDIKQGTFKYFAHKVDNILSDPGATPELQEAARALRSADDFYRESMGPLTDRHIQAVMNGLESGMPADPKVLFSTLVKEGRSDLTAKVREMVGPNLWAGVKAADTQEMLDASKTLVPGQIDGRAFARQVLERHRGNMLEAVHGREASGRLLKQAQDIEMLDGRLDVSARPNDTVTDVIRKASEAAQAVKEAARLDPIGALKKEMKQIETEHRAQVGKMRAERKSDPLGFLYEPSTLASQAVDKILGSEDLILAAAAKFGEQSPEFGLMRQLWTQRVLENTLRPGERLAKVSEEVQRVMFPGVTLKQMQILAKEMDFLLDTRRAAKGTAQGMSAMSKVEHPWSHILGGGGVVGKVLAAPTKLIPGSDAMGRFILGGYYGLIRKLATSPATLRWFEKGLTGSPEEKAAVRAVISKTLQKGGAVGAGAGEAAEQQGLQ